METIRSLKQLYNRTRTENTSDENGEEIENKIENTPVDLTTRLHFVRSKGKLAFLEIRENEKTIQVVYKDEKPMIKKIGSTPLESIVRVTGTLVKTKFPITGTFFHDYEIKGTGYELISESDRIPILVSNTDKIQAHLDTRLKHRVLDLRSPLNQALFRVRSMMLQMFRSNLCRQGFIEVNTPKLLGSVSESGAEVFTVDYFDGKAYLAQSPQLYKQMLINAGFERVLEIAPVFRAEKSNSTRHLTEYTGIDLEMTFDGKYTFLINFIYDLLYDVLKIILAVPEIETIRKYHNFEDPLLHDKALIIQYDDAITLLEKNGYDVINSENLNNQDEKNLGDVIKKMYNTDLFVLDGFPVDVRAFYTRKRDDGRTRSYDFIFRGREILSGAERISDPSDLVESIANKEIDTEPLKDYIESFSYGVRRHGGGGFGVERILSTLFDYSNVRETVLFPRDPSLLFP